MRWRTDGLRVIDSVRRAPHRTESVRVVELRGLQRRRRALQEVGGQVPPEFWAQGEHQCAAAEGDGVDEPAQTRVLPSVNRLSEAP